MIDIVDRNTRSRMMAAIKATDTSPELVVRKFLHSKGFRYRLHRKDLPGSPDIVLPKFGLVIFVHGCFWHRHDTCHYATKPASRKDFWKEKLDANRSRDSRQQEQLLQQGWRVLVVWECGLKHSMDRLHDLVALIESSKPLAEWPDRPPRMRSEGDSRSRD